MFLLLINLFVSLFKGVKQLFRHDWSLGSIQIILALLSLLHFISQLQVMVSLQSQFSLSLKVVPQLDSLLRLVEILQICVLFAVEIGQKISVAHGLRLDVHDRVCVGLGEVWLQIHFSFPEVSVSSSRLSNRTCGMDSLSDRAHLLP